ncbi:hypothetical protein [Puia sp.]|jgi:hypothetical protein|uniref:hypothetical protein n=1 Tax=Puia sp. TaxID=2045100 RepID=UPI002F3FD96F
MEYQQTEDILTQPPAFKLYKDSHIGIATFLGGPLIGGYLAAENFNRLGAPRGARNAWIIGIVSTLLIFSAVFLVPGITNLPTFVIPLLYSTITRVLVQKYQGNALRAHGANGGQYYNPWRAVGISLIGAALLLAVLIGIMYYSDAS